MCVKEQVKATQSNKVLFNYETSFPTAEKMPFSEEINKLKP